MMFEKFVVFFLFFIVVFFSIRILFGKAVEKGINAFKEDFKNDLEKEMGLRNEILKEKLKEVEEKQAKNRDQLLSSINRDKLE
jgi:Sec-independent protein translocase protein TatA